MITIGNVATGYTGAVHFTSSDSQASLPGNYTFAAANAGTRTFSVTLNTPGTQSVTAASTTTAGVTGTASVTVVSSGGASAAFLKQDTTTEGTWIGTYGSQGYNVIGSSASYPSYATVTATGQSNCTWTPSTTDPRALQTPGGSGRIAACWYSSTSLDLLDVGFLYAAHYGKRDSQTGSYLRDCPRTEEVLHAFLRSSRKAGPMLT